MIEDVLQVINQQAVSIGVHAIQKLLVPHICNAAPVHRPVPIGDWILGIGGGNRVVMSGKIVFECISKS